MKKKGTVYRTSRRKFIRTLGLTGAALFVPVKSNIRSAWAQLAGGTLDPTRIPKYREPLFVLPAMPRSGQIGQGGSAIDYYEIAVRQFRQQILPPGLPPTTVWSYGSLAAPGAPAQGGSFHYPAFTIEATWNTPTRVKWINDLKNPRTGNYLPHLLPVDQTLHWANPPGPRDRSTSNPAQYTGPVPLVPHLHGGHTNEDSDGYPEAWYLPAASNIPAGYATEGTWYNPFKSRFLARTGVAWEPGTATFQYTNDQRDTTLWYHDHALGIVRENVYAGPAGFYLLRGNPADSVSGRLPGLNPPGSANNADNAAWSSYEIPLMIQDRSFNSDGSLFYPDSREFFDGFGGPYVPNSDIAPIWNAEFFGNTMVVNGSTWPYLLVEKRRYRFRIVNACNTRFLILKMENDLPFWQIGADGGFLPEPVRLNRLLLAPAERADVIVDFSSVRAGTEIILLNLGPDEPFGGGEPGVDFASADPGTTGQVMKFRVVGATSADDSTPPDELLLPVPPDLGNVNFTRQVSFNELDSAVLADIGPRIGLLGTVNLSDPTTPMGMPMRWMDAATETPTQNTTEVWEIYDFTEDAHPMHIHQVQFEIINREVFDPAVGTVGTVQQPEAWETGRKDTVIIYPGTITRFKAHFDLAGQYVWHCHILEHEDNEMMRPLRVLPEGPKP